MKKIFTTIILCLGLVVLGQSNASAQSFQEGDLVLDAGVGLGSTYSWNGLGLPLGASLEYGVTQLETGAIGVGGNLGFVSGNGLSIFYIGGRGSHHFNELLQVEDDNVDLYGGIGIYYRNFNYSGFGSFNSGIVGSFHLGGRYYFSDNIGGFAEIGNNWAWLNAGVTVKF